MCVCVTRVCTNVINIFLSVSGALYVKSAGIEFSMAHTQSHHASPQKGERMAMQFAKVIQINELVLFFI